MTTDGKHFGYQIEQTALRRREEGDQLALSIHQPWAHLIVEGVQRCDNRPWKTEYRGEILIHASRNKRRICSLDDQVRSELGLAADARLAYSALIGVVELVACLSLSSLIAGQRPPAGLEWVRRHQFAEGPWVWVFENPRRFARPIESHGEPGLYTVPRLRLPAGVL